MIFFSTLSHINFKIRKLFTKFSTKNLQQIHKTLYESENAFSKIINKEARSYTRKYTFDANSFNYPNRHNYTKSNTYHNSHTFFLPPDNVTTMSGYEQKSGVRPREVGLRFLGSTR